MTDACPSDRCFGCWWKDTHRGGREAYVEDIRTGRRYCHECAEAWITWELAGCPDPHDYPYPAWLSHLNEAAPASAGTAGEGQSDSTPDKSTTNEGDSTR